MVRCTQKSALPTRCTWVSSYSCALKLRTRTPPEVKWLLVERATLAGDLATLKLRQRHLESKITQVQAAVHALDTTILLMEARLQPDAGGVIHRHEKGYGTRGALRAFIVETLQTTHNPLTTRDIAVVASMYFGLGYETGPDFNRYQRNTIRAQLYLLVDEGIVLKTGAEGARTVYWRWKRALPTLAALALLAGATSSPLPKGATDDSEDTSRYQVAHQRDGNATG